MLKAATVATTVVRACVKDSLKPAMANEAKSYFTLIKYEFADNTAKEVSRETFGTKE